ncbi:MAG: phosphoglyceromutase [Tepidanaerobacteraceae bacterium]|nr:phosphoglyceromutase [Tepidanaerobacteraceae bacterium]
MLRRIFLLLIIISLSPLNTAIVSASGAPQKKIVMLIMDNINYEDMAEFGGKNFKFLLKNGALGLMNTNSGGPYTDTNAYATIGAGSYAVGSSQASCSGGYSDVFSGQPVNEIYLRNTGKKMEKLNIANIDIIDILQNNQKLNHSVRIGLLGSLLNERGLKTAVIGNESKSPDETSANAAMITMNGNGITDFGRVDAGLLMKDPMSPFGIRTDYAALYSAFLDAKHRADFIVIQSGDSCRLNKYSGLSDEMYKKAKREIFHRADDFLGKILAEMDKNTLFMLVTPFPSYADAAAGRKLTPVIACGDAVRGTILTSPTTKRDGIITNTDLAAQVLNYFGIPRDSTMTGHEFIYKNMANSLEYIYRLNAITVFNYKIRPAVVKAFIGIIVAGLILAVIFILCARKYLIYLRHMLVAIMIAPGLFLILPLLQPWDASRLALGILLLAATSIASLSYFLKENLSIFAVCLLGSSSLIILDTWLGNPLMKVSIFGYDPVGGARFYGIGNEYMGLLLGSAIIGTAAIVDKFRHHEKTAKLLSIFFLAVVLFTLAHPALGTNVGGAMAALVGFGAFAALLFKEKLSAADIVKIGASLVILLLCLFIFDSTRPQDAQSHIGQTGALIRQSSIAALLLIFKRKLLMNYKLIRYSNWTLALIAMMAVLGMLFIWPVGILKQIFRRHRHLYFGFVAGIIGTAAAFVFNDSGVVAAAISMIPIGMPLILLCIDEIMTTREGDALFKQ